MLSNWLLVAHCSCRDDLLSLIRALPFVEECDVDLDIYALLPLYDITTDTTILEVREDESRLFLTTLSFVMIHDPSIKDHPNQDKHDERVKRTHKHFSTFAKITILIPYHF